MQSKRITAATGTVRLLFESGGSAGASDAELLARFADRGPGAESAFAALLDRHGPMVLAVCRRLTDDRAAADDAFQATFLALVRRADAIRLDGSLAPWLYAVARRIALRARSRRVESPAAEHLDGIDHADPAEAAERAEAARLLHDEIGRLPERYRAPVILCHLEQRTHEQAAAELGWPVGTVRGRLARARHLLRDRLARRGVGPAAGAALLSLRREATAAVPPALEAATRALMVAARSTGAVAAGAVPGAVLALARYGTTPMLFTNAKLLLVGPLALLTIGAGAVLAAREPSGPQEDRPDGRAAEKPMPAVGDPIPRVDPRGIAGPGPEADRFSPTLVPITVESADTDFGQFLWRLQEATGAPIAFDLAAMTALSKQGPGAIDSMLRFPIGRTLRNVPASEALRSVLAPHGLGVLVVFDRLVITARTDDAPRPEEAEAGAAGPQSRNLDQPGPADRRGADAEATAPVDDVQQSTDDLLLPTIESVESLFAENALEAMEVAAAIDALERLKGFEAGDEPTEIGRFVAATRAKLEERLAAFADRPEDARPALERLRAELQELAALHGALTGDQNTSVARLGQRCLKRLGTAHAAEAFSADQAMFDANRVQALFTELGMELGPPIVSANGGLGFGMGGMGGMGGIGGGFR